MIKNSFVLFIVCIILFIFFLKPYVKMQQMYSRNKDYERQIQQLIQENEHLTEERRRLLEDPDYLETVARKKFGIIKEGETIYKILPPGVIAKDEVQKEEEKPKVKPKTSSTQTSSKKKTSTAKKKTSSTKKQTSTRK